MNKNKFYGVLAILFLTSTIGFSSCKKDKDKPKDTPTNGTAKAVVKYGDKTVNFSSGKDKSGAFLDWRKDEKKYNFALTLQDAATGMIIDMMVYPAENGTGTYALEGLTADGWSTAGVYVKGKSSSKADTYNYVWISHNGELTESEGTVTISSMTEKNVKGTFSATLHSYNPDTKVSKQLTVSGGTFDVPLVRRDFDFANYE